LPPSLPAADTRGSSGGAQETRTKEANLIVDVRQPNGEPLPVAVALRLKGAGVILEESAEPAQRSRAIFRHAPLGPFVLYASAEGYAGTDVSASLDTAGTTRRVLIHLRAASKERAPGGSWVPPLSASNAALFARAVEALRGGKPGSADKYMEKLMHNAPGHPEVNYLAGAVAYRRNESASALMYFSKAAYLNPDSEDAARALGTVLYRGGNYSGALEAFSAAARLRPDVWETQWAAASAAYRAGAYRRACDFAQRAAERPLRPEPHLLLALSQSRLQEWDQARSSAEEFLKRAGDSSLAPVAKQLIESSAHQNNFILDLSQPPAIDRIQGVLVHEELIEPHLPSRMWAPPDVDEAVPIVAQGAICPERDVIQAASKEVARMAGGLGEVGAREEILQEELDGAGRGKHIDRFNTNYDAAIRVLRNGELSVDEVRNRSTPEATKGSAPVAHGLVALALVFHPEYLEDFTFRCEGLTDWKGRPAWSIYFTQKLDRRARLHIYMENGQAFPAYVKGRALVDQANSEILHMETDLINPIHDLRLEQEHMVVDYGPVTFNLTGQRFWLPSQADLFVHLYGRLYHVRHSLRDYVVYKVDTTYQIKAPKAPPEP
jgi:tetratricopeptide (TPR) repeat protein